MDSLKRIRIITEKSHPYMWQFVRAQRAAPLHIRIFSQLDLEQSYGFHFSIKSPAGGS